MLCCIIFHNMMVEQRQMDSTVDWSYEKGTEYSLDVNISSATKPM